MQDDTTLRTAMLLGAYACDTLKLRHVALFGLGGVGGHCAEALARAGIGHMFIVDSDRISPSNLNRQLVATRYNIDFLKAIEMTHRINEISRCKVTPCSTFITPENIEEIMPDNVDFIIDAVDNIAAKLALVQYAYDNDIQIISCMGMGNRLNPTAVRIGDIFSVKYCPLARTMRRELRKRGIEALPVVHSLEQPLTPLINIFEDGKPIPASSPFVPAAAGITAAFYAVMHLLPLTMR